MTGMFGIKGFDRREYAISANAVLGIRDSGKTYTATEATEELYDGGIPSIWLDPIGVAHNLRIPGKGRGYPIVVAGGKHGDLPLTPKNVGEIVRAAMVANVSLVIDLFSVELSKSDWRRIVRETMQILLHENEPHGLRHIFIEEAAEFVPQRPFDMDVYSAVEKVVRMGGNSKLGITLINQRSADLNKSVLELCANVFVHRQKGKNTLLDLKKWIGLLNMTAAEEQKIADSLPDLKSGQCWALINDLPKPVFLKVPQKNSLHPDRRAISASPAELAKRKPVPADKFVGAMKAALAAAEAKKALPRVAAIAPAPAKAALPSPREETERARSLEKAIADTRAQAAAQFREAMTAAIEAEVSRATDRFKGEIDALAARLASNASELLHLTFERLKAAIRTARLPASTMPAAMADTSAPRPFAPAASPISAPRASNGALPKGEEAILKAIAQFGPVDRDQLSVLAGYKKTSRDTYVQKLAQGHLIEVNGKELTATAAGISALGDFERLPTGSALREYWFARLPEGEKALLRAICESYPADLDRESLGDLTEYRKTSRDTYIQKLAARKLILTPGRGRVIASARLFD